MLRYKADRRTVAYMIVTTALLVVQWLLPELNPWLFTASLLMAVSVAVIAHNHNHLRIWKRKPLNALTDYWLTVFYGFPVFAWIPTHNMNHHKYTNGEGDYTITYRYSEGNNLLTLLTYPTISGVFQQPPVRDYLRATWAKNRKRFWYYISQYVALVVWIGAALLIDWRKALLYVVIPQQVSLFTVLIFNYVQHVHADEASERDHSRNIVGPVLNLFLFNNGYHTVHHNKPGLHWSKAREEHERIAHEINPALNEPSFVWYLVRVYLLGLFIPSLRTRSLRLARLEREAASAPASAAPSLDAALERSR